MGFRCKAKTEREDIIIIKVIVILVGKLKMNNRNKVLT